MSRSLRTPLVLTVAAALAGAPARASGSAGCDGDEQEQKRCAKGHYAARRYAAAAEAYDALWTSTRASKYLYNAAVAREAAGSRGWALALWHAYLELPEVVPSEQVEAKERIARLFSETVLLTLEVTPVAALGDAAVLHVERKGERFSYPLALLARTHGYQVHLDSGEWRLSVEPASHAAAYNRADGPHTVEVSIPPGAREATARLRLNPETATMTLQFGPRSEVTRGVTIHLRDPLGTEPDIHANTRGDEWRGTLRKGPWEYTVRPRGLEREPRSGALEVQSPGTLAAVRWTPPAEVLAERKLGRQLSLGLGLAAGGTAIGGAALVVEGGQSIRARPNSGFEGSYVTFTSFERRLAMSAWGGGLLGGGLGLGTAAGLEALRPTRKRMLAELLAGSLTLAAGLVWHGVQMSELVRQKKFFPSDLEPEYMREDGTYGWRLSFAVSGAVLGFGAGLLFGAATGEISRRVLLERSSLRASVGAGPGALVLTIGGSL